MTGVNRDHPPAIPGVRFDRIVGRGGMATVWRAWHEELGKTVAIKVLDPDFAATGQDVRRFMLEVRTMCELDHPGIVRGYDADCIGGRYYFVMDFVDGYTLATHLARKTRLTWEDAVIICETVADALDYAWQNFRLVHCDLKPDNLMVGRDGLVRILDLGLCQSTASLRRSSDRSDEIIGTPAYISPEQVQGGVELDCRADIYSLGASLYHLVTGRMPFPLLSNEDMVRAHVDPRRQAPDPRRFVPKLPEGFVRLLAGMLVKDRAWRYTTWRDVLDAFLVFDRGGLIPPLPDAAVSTLGIGL